MNFMQATLPVLPKCLGYALDTANAAFGWLRPSTDEFHDAAALRRRMREDGYLYLPGFWEREEVAPVRAAILDHLVEEGTIDTDYPVEEAVAKVNTGKGRIHNDFAKRCTPLQTLLYSGEIIEFFDRFLGGRCAHFDHTWMRCVGPGASAHPHCDIVYMGRGTKDLYSVWVPYGDISLKLGGLMVLEKSHLLKDTRLKSYTRRDTDTICINGPKYREYLEGTKRWNGSLSYNPYTLRSKLGGRWLTTEYSMGDVVIFNMFLVHGSVENQTNRIRLSSDSRYQLASESIDERWVGENPVGHTKAGKRGRVC